LSGASTSLFAAAWNGLARTLIRPHGEEARARYAAAMLLMFRARAVSNQRAAQCCYAAAWNGLARTLIRPHGEEARARDAAAMLLMFRTRAVSNHEGGAMLLCRRVEWFGVDSDPPSW
jgi:hypothetical protein